MRTLLAFTALLSAPALAAAPAIHVTGWARPTVAGQAAGAAYLTIHNAGSGADRLVGLSSPAAAMVSVHQTSTAGGVARMRPAGPLAVAPNQTMTMGAGGLHVMLMGLKAPLRPGARLPLTLRFERAGLVRTNLLIQMSAPDAGHAHH
ncbi:copper chaperone PCu(A)C [Sphingomonas sp. BN140010]|uniref:Copper chaperone PCu(A)C n=1 Tax=Sphingomonas arvum TaxID=2992113 RepID=A0ABT3JCF4_9SPHN|nr:copper chaperone PCu(A)C [Sphingomonas sp. BN140010]MCW3796763.1 copper chaperone PCu(A)C [Sphingomonas sp. BN140010]